MYQACQSPLLIGLYMRSIYYLDVLRFLSQNWHWTSLSAGRICSGPRRIMIQQVAVVS
jgi:hypothetical protein